MSKLSRRSLLATGGAIAGLAACSETSKPSPRLPQSEASEHFAHGIASGDPRADGAIIWTRITPEDNSGSPILFYQISETQDFTVIVQKGTTQTSAARDFTVKAEIDSLSPAQTYFYRFQWGEIFSPIGSFKTLPTGEVESARFAIVSCSHWEGGYFNVYDHIARDDGYDAVLHLGDYYYEYAPQGWGKNSDIDRVHAPAHELLSLADYRTRHAQYRTDPSLQAMSASTAIIPLWDDHETANDSYKDGAQNHDPTTEGAWSERRKAALQAYYEWMPIAEPKSGQSREALLRSYSYGDLLTFVTLETRLMARAEPINIDEYTKDMNSREDAERFRSDVLNAPNRPMIGAAQTDYVIDALSRSKAAGQPWRLIGNQILMGRVHTTDMGPYMVEESIAALEVDWPGVRDFVRNSAFELPVYPDTWDGYPWAREQFFTALDEAGINDMVVITGDSHEFWLNDLARDNGTKVGVEIGTSSVSSPTLKAYFGDNTSDYCLLLTKENEPVRYYDANDNGYIDLTLGRKTGLARLIVVDTVSSRDYTAKQLASFKIARDGDSVKFKSPKGLSMTQRALFSGLG